MAEERMWIDGEWCAAENGETSEAMNPATGEVMAAVPKATVGDVDRCVEASRKALRGAEWKKMDPAQRGRVLNKMAAVTYEKAKELAVIESSNNGKTFREALSEIRYGAWTLEYFAGLTDKERFADLDAHATALGEYLVNRPDLYEVTATKSKGWLSTGTEYSVSFAELVIE